MNFPKIINKLLTQKELDNALSYYSMIKNKDLAYDDYRKRYTANDPMSQMILMSKTDIAREVFGSKTLLPTYSVYSRYVGPGSKLEKHKDDNACTYTLDLCLNQSNPWGIWVDGKEYILKENQALAYYGNDQFHWREEMTESDSVSMIFLHYAEPEHWWFKRKNK